jgi:hypothetical protein
MTLFRFSYSSIASVRFDEAALLRLRLDSENHNDRHAVTGLLVFDGVGFVQTIEGPEKGVEYIVDRIMRDSRHHDIKITFNDHVVERQFEGWSLKIVWKRPITPVADFVQEVKSTVASLTDPDTAAYFLDFVTGAKSGRNGLGLA